MHIWTSIRKFFQDHIEPMGVQEASFPMFLSATSLAKVRRTPTHTDFPELTHRDYRRSTASITLITHEGLQKLIEAGSTSKGLRQSWHGSRKRMFNGRRDGVSTSVPQAANNGFAEETRTLRSGFAPQRLLLSDIRNPD